MSNDEAAEICRVHRRTITNWDRQGTPVPAMRSLEFFTQDLGIFHADWRGFWINHRDKMYGPNGLQISAEHLTHYPNLMTELSYWKKRALNGAGFAVERD